MNEIKLNQWQYGVVPKLHPESVLRLGGHVPDRPQEMPSLFAYCSLAAIGCEHDERWYAVLSLGPPEMPAEELRLPEGWEVFSDEENLGEWMLGAIRRTSRDSRTVRKKLIVFEPTRAECVREINRLLEGER